MGKQTLLADAGVVGLWLAGLIPIEWAALIAGLIGCVLGGLALFKATRTLRLVEQMQSEEAIKELEDVAKDVQAKIDGCDP